MNQNKKEIKIIEYSNKEIILSDNQSIKGSTIISDDGRIFPINVGDSTEIFLKNVDNYNFLEMFKNKEIFLVGCGANFIIPDMKIRKVVSFAGLKLEWLTTPMALQTFNLLIEDKRDCFALIINNEK